MGTGYEPVGSVTISLSLGYMKCRHYKSQPLQWRINVLCENVVNEDKTQLVASSLSNEASHNKAKSLMDDDNYGAALDSVIQMRIFLKIVKNFCLSSALKLKWN